MRPDSKNAPGRPRPPQAPRETQKRDPGVFRRPRPYWRMPCRSPAIASSDPFVRPSGRSQVRATGGGQRSRTALGGRQRHVGERGQINARARNHRTALGGFQHVGERGHR
jgi:hypothetical protein